MFLPTTATGVSRTPSSTDISVHSFLDKRSWQHRHEQTPWRDTRERTYSSSLVFKSIPLTTHTYRRSKVKIQKGCVCTSKLWPQPIQLFWYSETRFSDLDACYIDITTGSWPLSNGPGIVWGCVFFRFVFIFPVLSISLAICSILELEAAISTVLAAFLSSNLSFSMVCNILVLELFMEHGSLQLGFI